jgi:transcriptional regulator with XRE-family HTH domain
MVIGERIRTLRVEKKLSQGDIEARTGLLRCYISRVENGHTVPAIETLEKLSRAIGIELYQFFVEGAPANGARPISTAKYAQFAEDIEIKAQRMSSPDRKLLLRIAGLLARRRA